MLANAAPIRCNAPGDWTFENATETWLAGSAQRIKEGDTGAVGVNAIVTNLSNTQAGAALHNQQALLQELSQNSITMRAQ